jgi:hypothetical protein
MNTSSLFAAGESLLPVKGDPRRQAVASLRGYAYQLYASALAWIGLQTGEQLHLEVAEDYATLIGSVLTGVQVRDTARSSTLTVNNEDVLNALDGFVDLVERNPSHKVHLRYLTTSEIGRERDKSDQVNGEAVLLYWRKAAAAAEVAPLRSALLRSGASGRVKKFISSRTDEQVREHLLRRVHWDTGAKHLDDVQELLATSLVEFASTRLNLSPSDCVALPDVVLVRVLDTVVKPSSSRMLVMADLLRVCEAAGKTTLSKGALEGLLRLLSPSGGASQLVLGARTVFEAEASYPAIQTPLPRSELIDLTCTALRACDVAFVVGSSGMGKTTAARIAAQRVGGNWLVLPLLDRTAEETERLIATALAQIATHELSGLIVDDLNEIESPAVRRQFARLLAAVRRRDAVCVVTAYREPTTSTLEACGLLNQPVIRIPSLSLEEVGQLVAKAGGDPALSGQLVYLLSSRGHPQLVRAVIASARRSGWAALEGETAVVAEVQADLDSERRRLRRTLVARLDENTRRLLLRASLLHGSFPRALAQAIGDVPPELSVPGELLNSLLGAWIDEVGTHRLRVSPLVGNAGTEDLSASEQQATHALAARWLSPVDGTIDATAVNALFFHAIRGEVDQPLTQIALAVFLTAHDKLQLVADVFPLLVHSPTNCAIIGKNPRVSKMLRLAQLLLVSGKEADRSALAVWLALIDEMRVEEQTSAGRTFEALVLAKSLTSGSLPAALPRPMLLLVRFFELAQSEPALSSLVGSFEDSREANIGWTGSVTSFLFTLVAMRIGTVDRQRQLFLDLDGLGFDRRQRFLPEPESSHGWVQTVVNAAWLAESKAGTLLADSAVATFELLEALCLRWNRPDFAVRFRVARAVMHDEYRNSPELAESVLVGAESLFGSNPVVARAKIRLRFRHKRYQDVLSELDLSLNPMRDADSLEQALLFREIGISAAGTGDWRGASRWLGRAYQALRDSPIDRPAHLRIGLRADAALAGFKGSERGLAILEYGEVLTELLTLNADESLEAAYCHRVVRHGLLWLYVEARGDAAGLEVDGKAPYLLAGMCSNLNPSEAIRSQELAHADTAWYLLAAVEARFVGIASARSNLAVRLLGREVVSLELTSRAAFLECAVRNRSAEEFVDAIEPWMNCLVHISANMQEFKKSNVVNPKYASVPAAPASALAGQLIQEPLVHAILAFGALCALANDAQPLRHLAAALPGRPGCEHVLDLVDRMVSSSPTEDRLKSHLIASAVRSTVGEPALTPSDLYVVTLRLLQACHGSSFRRAYESAFVAWTKSKWRELVGRKFLLKSASAVVPAIEVALQHEGLRSVAALLRTTRIGFAVSLPESIYEWLRSIEHADPSSTPGF